MPDPAFRVAGRLLLLGIVAVATLAFVVSLGDEERRERPAAASAAAWEGLVAGHEAAVDVGQRVLVVLRLPSLADRVAGAGGVATDRAERRWTRQALTEQRIFISRMVVQGARIRAEFNYTRVINGFSAALDPAAIALLERAPEVEGVYPVRAAYPATVPSSAAPAFDPAAGRRPGTRLPGFDGRGVTIALLDTGVDRFHPYLRGRIAEGIDIVGGSELALPARPPGRPADLERHGTELAGIVVGREGPGGLAGVAPGATLIPIRVAGWQRGTTGEWAVTSRTDQILAGLERAVDPNDDGDAHDAARIALLGAVEPLAGFATGPLVRAAAGALKLDTLVVTPAGNDGPRGPGFGVVSGPGGARDALTVGAADLRLRHERAHAVVRAGLEIVLDTVVPLAGAVVPFEPRTYRIGRPELETRSELETSGGQLRLDDFFADDGTSLVAGRAALVPAGAATGDVVRLAAQAGAAAVVLHGASVPPGGVGLDERVSIPVLAVPDEAVQRLNRAEREGADASIAIGRAEAIASVGARRVAPFSSRGLAFDGRVKPELVAPGVGVLTSEPGSNEDGSGRYGSINGSSAAAAATAGAAALLVQARPDLSAAAIKGLLVGTARRLPRTPSAAQGTGVLDVEAAAAAEIFATPSALAFGRPVGRDWRKERRVVVRNLSSRTLRVAVDARITGFPAADTDLRVRPRRLILRPDAVARVRVGVRIRRPARAGPPAEGAIVLRPLSGRRVRVPFAVPFTPPRPPILGAVTIEPTEFEPSETTPAVLSFRAGAVRSTAGHDELEAVERVDVEIWTADEKRIGVAGRLRNILPGTFTFGITGRDPGGQELAPGDYVLRVIAFPAGGGPPTRQSLSFTIT